MIIWLASYPKSGNTWLRSMLASYFYSQNGVFNFDLLNYIDQFPSFDYFKNYKDKFERPEDTAAYWLDAQKKINEDKKIKFFKTHTALCKIEDNVFTNKQNSLGAIYIIRDPRNVVSSIFNHFDKTSYEEALTFMKDEKRCLLHKENERYLGFIPLFSWKTHQNSWIKNNIFPVLTIRYEDLHTQTFKTLEKVINFVKLISKSNQPFKRDKAKKVVKSCEFSRMQKMENENGFPEAVMKKKENKKINFFHLGPKKNYKDILDKEILSEMNSLYREQLKEFKYE